MLVIKLLVCIAFRVSGQNLGNHPDACSSFFEKFKNLDKTTTKYFGYKEDKTNVQHCLFNIAQDKYGTSGNNKVFKKAEADQECHKYDSWLPQLRTNPLIPHTNAEGVTNQFGDLAATFGGHGWDVDNDKGYIPLGATPKGQWTESQSSFTVRWDKGTDVESTIDKAQLPMTSEKEEFWNPVDETSVVVLYTGNGAWRSHKPDQFPMDMTLYLYCHYFPATPRPKVGGNHPDACNPLFAKFKDLDKTKTTYFGYKEPEGKKLEHCLFKLAEDKYGTSGDKKVFKKAEADKECEKYGSWLPQLRNDPFIPHNGDASLNQFGDMSATFGGSIWREGGSEDYVPLGASVKGKWEESPEKFKVQWDKGTNVETELDKTKPPLSSELNKSIDYWKSADETSIVVLFVEGGAWRAHKPDQIPIEKYVHFYCHYFPGEPRQVAGVTQSPNPPGPDTEPSADPGGDDDGTNQTEPSALVLVITMFTSILIVNLA